MCLKLKEWCFKKDGDNNMQSLEFHTSNDQHYVYSNQKVLDSLIIFVVFVSRISIEKECESKREREI